MRHIFKSVNAVKEAFEIFLIESTVFEFTLFMTPF